MGHAPPPSNEAVHAALARRRRPRDPPADHRARHGQGRRASSPTGSRHGRGLPHRRRLPDARQDHRATSPPPSAPVAGRHAASRVDLDVMSDEQRKALQTQPARRRGAEPVIPFAQPGSLHPGLRGGVAARAASASPRSRSTWPPRWPPAGLSVGVVDADIYGHSVPRMLGTDRPAHPGRGHDHAAAGARREGHLDRHVHPGQRRRGLARPDAAPGAAAVPRRRLLGRPRRAAARPAARHRRHRDLRWPSCCRTRRSSW